jgi:exopolyphosphatase/guanosine-5'-triphosphate,3'-diphosphate pyrophosphatase
MRCACIDIGSNTTRLLVADVERGRLAAVVQQRSFTRIGRAIAADGVIPRALIEHVAEVVATQREVAAVAGAEHLRVVATAAIRRALNRDELLAALREHARVEVTVVPGEHEARLAFAGATRTLESPPRGSIAVVDVGGLSTEIAVGTMAGGVTWARSYAIGSSALAAGCAADPPSPADRAAMRAAARAAFEEAGDETALGGDASDASGGDAARAVAANAARAAGGDEIGGAIPPADHAIAVGGSAASLPTLVGPVLDRAALERALAVLTSAPAEEIARLHDLVPERTQLLPAGILVLGAAAERLGRPLRIGRGGLREGVILELAAGN